MAVTLVGSATGMTKGLDSVEVGIKVESLTHKAKPQFIEPVLDHVGHRIGSGIGHSEEEISISGEIVWDSGDIATGSPMVPQFITAVTTIANEDNELATGGGYYMQDCDISKNRGSWQTISANFMAWADHT